MHTIMKSKERKITVITFKLNIKRLKKKKILNHFRKKDPNRQYYI